MLTCHKHMLPINGQRERTHTDENTHRSVSKKPATFNIFIINIAFSLVYETVALK